MPASVVLITRRKKKKEPPVGKSHFHKLIADLPGGPYYTVGQLAFLIERTPTTVKRWIRDGKVAKASKKLKAYGQVVYLYTDDDVERYREYAESV